MLFSALNDVLKQRAPFLINSLSSLINSPLDELQKIVTRNLRNMYFSN